MDKNCEMSFNVGTALVADRAIW